MAQIIYAVLALMLTGLLSLSVNKAVHSNEEKMILNEVGSQMVGVGNELLDEVGVVPYDWETVGGTIVLNVNDLAPTIVGGTGCDLDDQKLIGCDLMNHFHGKTATRIRGGLRYTAEVRLRYVDINNWSQTAAGPSFAKEVEVTVKSEDVLLGVNNSEPLTVVMKRVYTHPSVVGTSLNK